jgi:molybdenum cofactor cytidylyltransferase
MNGEMEDRPTRVSGVVLAAGSARRMNAEKLMLELGARPLVCRVVDEVIGSGVAETVVIVNPANEAAIRSALPSLPVRIVVNPRASEGLGTSIATGAAAVSPESAALLLVQADQPLVHREMLRTLLAEWGVDDPPYVASRFGDVVTTPVLFGRALVAELVALGGDRGARAVLDRHAERGRVVAFPDWCGADVDTPADYERVRALFETGEHPHSVGRP